MIFIYSETRQCLREAVRIYQKRFPEHICPSRFTYANIIKIFRHIIGSSDRKKCVKCKTVIPEIN